MARYSAVKKRAMPAKTRPPPRTWVPVSRTDPCKQIAATWCEQGRAPAGVCRSSHPPITAMASPAITSISALPGRRRGPLCTFGGGITGTASRGWLAAYPATTSEERRGGEEGRSPGGPDPLKKKDEKQSRTALRKTLSIQVPLLLVSPRRKD